jgi:hypothetical protein
VSDALDQCPETPSGEVGSVDANGCGPSQRDTDADGVNDALDQCPGTPSAAEVDESGCSAAQRAQPAEVDGWIIPSWAYLAGGVGLLVLVGLLLSLLFFRRGSRPEVGNTPLPDTRGSMRSDGREWLEHPEGSGIWYWRDPDTGDWIRH